MRQKDKIGSIAILLLAVSIVLNIFQYTKSDKPPIYKISKEIHIPVSAFGAKADGKQDATPYIQKAVNFAQFINGEVDSTIDCIIKFDSGCYYLKSNVNVISSKHNLRLNNLSFTSDSVLAKKLNK